MTLDPHVSYSVPALKARGLRVVQELHAVVETRAKDADEDFSEACARLPKPWHATMLLAHVLERFERDEFIPEIIRDFAEIDDRTLLITALKEIKETTLAKQFVDAEDVIDDDPKVAWKSFGPPEPGDLVRLHKKIYALVGLMDEAFPPAES